MPGITDHPRMAKLLERRCFFLFMALLSLLVALPFLAETAHGRMILMLVNVTVMLTAVAAVGEIQYVQRAPSHFSRILQAIGKRGKLRERIRYPLGVRNVHNAILCRGV